MDRYKMAQQKWKQTHNDAVNRTIFYLKQKWKLMIRPEYPILLADIKYRHQYDIVGFLNDDEISFYEDESTILTKIPIRKFLRMSDRELVYSEYKGLLDNHVRVVVEMDNLTSHSHTEQVINDGEAYEAAKKVFPQNMIFIRLIKEELSGHSTEKNMNEYLAKHVDTAMENLV